MNSPKGIAKAGNLYSWPVPLRGEAQMGWSFTKSMSMKG